MDDTADSEIDCPQLQGGGCAGGKPVDAVDCAATGSDSPPDPPTEAQLQGDGCACATTTPGPSVLPLLLLAVVALRRWLPALVALFVATGAFAADAQQFAPADGGAFAGLVEGDLGEPWEGRAAITTSYATNVAVLRAGEDEWPVLPSVVTAEVGASLRIDRWFSVGVVVPAHLRVVFEEDRLPPLRGDVSVRIAVPLNEASSPIRANWGMQWDVPGHSARYLLGDSGAAVGRLAVDADAGPVLLGANLGLRMQRPRQLPGLHWGNRFEYGFGAVLPMGRLAAGAELIGSLPTKGGLTEASVPVEVYGTVRASPLPTFAFRVGAGAGLGRGLGAPGFRAFVGVDLRTREPRDPDLDGLVNVRDRCDHDPEDFDKYADADGCPDPDNDRDGLLDPVDACPNDPEVHNGWEDADGCPDELAQVRISWRSPVPLEEATVRLEGASDRHEFAGETLMIEVIPGTRRLQVLGRGHHPYDAPVKLKEGPQELIVELTPIFWGGLDVILRSAAQPIAGFAIVEGETRDVPASGVVLKVEGGERTVAFGAPGHVSQYLRFTIPRGGVVATTVDLERLDVFVEADRIQVREEMRFATDQAEPLPESLPALEALAAWLLANPQVELVRVEGHADGIGGSRHNYDLSVRRAEAVRARLIALGVAPERLVAVGAGEARTVSVAEDAGSRKVGLLVLIWDDEASGRPDAPAP